MEAVFLDECLSGNTPVLLLAHGAGAGGQSDFMQAISCALNKQGVRVLRFEFDYMKRNLEQGKKSPPPRVPILLNEFQRAILEAKKLIGDSPLFIGGKSMGGRVASLLSQDEKHKSLSINGCVCLGYPFHPVGKPEQLRTEHLKSFLFHPLLIVQGERDPFGTKNEVGGYGLNREIELHWLVDGDHDFKPRKKSGFSQQEHVDAAAARVASFMYAHA